MLQYEKLKEKAMGLFNFFKREDSLISNLKKHHRELFKIYEKILKLLHNKKIDKIPERLEQFNYKFKQHIMYEENFFYTKLHHMYRNDEEKQFYILSKKEEMKNIAKAIEKFIKKYTNVEMIRQEINLFEKELIKFGEILKKRISFEENVLYLMYKS
jgi:hemerythrin-like domain-containing protein